MLISLYRIHGKKTPHWVVVTGTDERFIYIHDPFVDVKNNKTSSDCLNVPIARLEFDRMARYGGNRLRADRAGIQSAAKPRRRFECPHTSSWNRRQGRPGMGRGAQGTALTARDFVTSPERLQGKKQRVVNLSGEYCVSRLRLLHFPLAEARGYKVVAQRRRDDAARAQGALCAGAARSSTPILRKDIEKMADKPRAAFTLTYALRQADRIRASPASRARCSIASAARSLRAEIEYDERWSVDAPRAGGAAGP